MQVGRMFINREMETVRRWHSAGDFQSCQQSGDRRGRSYSNLAINSHPSTAELRWNFLVCRAGICLASEDRDGENLVGTLVS